jgi:hypothetical protein
MFSALREASEGRDCHVLVDGAQIVTDEISAIPDLIVTCSALDFSTPAVAEADQYRRGHVAVYAETDVAA